MQNMWKAFAAVAAVAAIGATGCERNDYDRDRTNDRIERKADRAADRTEDATDRAGEKVEQAGRDVKAGAKDIMQDLRDGATAYEVHRIDKEARSVELRRADAKIGTREEKEMQSGLDSLTLSYAELEQFVEGDKKGEEIADELHDGENVHVWFDASKKVKKISY